MTQDVAVHEIMLVNPAIKNLIRENKVSQINSALQTGQQYGMQTMDQALIKAVKVEIFQQKLLRFMQYKKNYF